MKKSFLLLFFFIIGAVAIAQDFVNPIPKREIRKLERWMMRRYRRNKDCDCTISRDSITMIHVFWVGYDTEGFIDKDCFISLDFAKHIKPWHDQYGCQRYLRTCTVFFDNRDVYLGLIAIFHGLIMSIIMKNYMMRSQNMGLSMFFKSTI